MGSHCANPLHAQMTNRDTKLVATHPNLLLKWNLNQGKMREIYVNLGGLCMTWGTQENSHIPEHTAIYDAPQNHIGRHRIFTWPLVTQIISAV